MNLYEFTHALSFKPKERTEEQQCVILNVVKDFPFFQSIPLNLVPIVSSYLTCISCDNKDTLLFRRGEAFTSIHILIRGSVVSGDDESLNAVPIGHCLDGSDLYIEGLFHKHTIIAQRNCILATLSQDTFRRIIDKNVLRKYPEVKIDFFAFYEFLRSIEPLKLIERRELERFAHYLTPFLIDRKQVIFKENDTPKGIYFVVQGTATLLQSVNLNENLDLEPEYHMFEINRISEGDYFGDLSILCDTCTQYAVLSKTPMLCLFISANMFREIVSPQMLNLFKEKLDKYVDSTEILKIIHDKQNWSEYRKKLYDDVKQMK
eukprot:TRINITY_DN2139_c0_g1_i1.p1 TRINITY_DN2139_c0_g1~~TRINITY_DN2139_c0_g1_i1.p1  ORF type:complete len:319 (+),score=62.66 TRINITY_DN2139_c0_g1_i1:713-1669(+)